MKSLLASFLNWLSTRLIGWLGLFCIISACTASGKPDLSLPANDEVSSIPAPGTNIDSGEYSELAVDVFIVDRARSMSLVETAVASTARLYKKCRISLKANIAALPVSSELVISKAVRYALAARYHDVKPAVFVVSNTDENNIAYSYLPSLNDEVAGTAWLTNSISEACLAWIMTHEIGHILFDNGIHSAGSKNVMSNNCKSSNWGSTELNPTWTDTQCDALRRSAFVQG